VNMGHFWCKTGVAQFFLSPPLVCKCLRLVFGFFYLSSGALVLLFKFRCQYCNGLDKTVVLRYFYITNPF